MSDRFTIGDWRVEPARGYLKAVGHPDLEVRLEPKAMQVLLALAERRGEVVAKEELVEAVWQDAFVSDQVLVNAVWELRRALGDDSKSPRYIQTIPRRGYRLAAEIRDEAVAGKRSIRGALVATLATIAVLAAIWLWPRQRPESPPVVRFAIQPETPLGPLYLPALAISANASKLVFTARAGATTELRLRQLDRLQDVAIPGTTGGHAPFFSPDGLRVGFFAESELRSMRLEGGGPPVTLAQTGVARGASWGPDGWIYFARGSGGGLWRVRQEGGEAEPVTELAAGEWSHRWPQVLPDGDTLVFVVADAAMRSSFAEARIVALSLISGEQRELVRGGTFPRYAAGKLYWVREGQVLAASFDARRLAIGDPRPVQSGASWYPINGAAQMSVSAGGSLAYVPGSAPWQPLRRLRWIGPSGDVLAATEPSAEARLYYDPALSADGRRLAVAIAEAGNSDLWVVDLERRTWSRLTDSSGEDQGPVWHPDGRHIAYYSSLSGPFQMYLTEISGNGTPRRLLTSNVSQRPECFSADGRRLIFSQNRADTGFDLWSLDLEGPAEPEPFLVTPYNELQARLSPDGRWLAYVSDETGKREIYLRLAEPEDSRRWLLSAGGGGNPVWNPSSRSLYYQAPEAIHQVEIVSSPDRASEPEIGRSERLIDWGFPRQLLEGEHRRSFDVDRAGSRFLVLESLEVKPPPIHVVLHRGAD